MNVDKTNVCLICETQINSDMEIMSHIMNEHTLRERVDNLYERRATADTEAK